MIAHRGLAAAMLIAVLWQPNHAEDSGNMLMDLQRQEDEAEMKKDMATLDRMFADDFFVVEPDGRVVNKTAYLARIKNDGSIANASIDYEDVVVHRYGETAIVNYRVKFGYAARADAFRVTVVWVRQANRWQTATFHWSPTQPQR
jgi:ketosteroid isomerase-like protein